MVDFVRKVCIALLQSKHITDEDIAGITRVRQYDTSDCVVDTEEDGEDAHEIFVQGLPYMHYEWDEGLECTGEEVRAYLAAYPNLLQDVADIRKNNLQRIAELNKQIGSMINELTELCEEADIDVTIDLGQHGSLDPNSGWNESRC